MKYLILTFTSLLVFACTYDVIEIPVECTEPLTISTKELKNSACGVQNGSFSLEVNAVDYQSEPLTYKINNEAPQSSPTFEGLAAGTYIVLVSNGVCEASIDLVIENEEGLNAAFSIVEANCGSSDGAINVSFNNASGNVQFSLDGGAAQSSPDFTDLEAGSYLVNVSDEAGCNVEIAAEVENASNYSVVEGIVSGSCAVSGCHAGNVSPDFRVKSNIIDRADRILARTSAMTMPPPSSGSSLSEEQISDIACWVESGAKG